MKTLKDLLTEINADFKELDKNKYLIQTVNNNKIQINVNDEYYCSDKFVPFRSQYEEMLSNIENNIRTINFYNNTELLEQYDLVKSMIKSRLNLSDEKIFARKCEILELPIKVAKEFANENHISGHSNARYYFGLAYKGQLVAMMSFGIPRFSKKYNYELIRYCGKQNCNVIGGASKLFSFFVKNILKENETITTYANRRISEGNLYRKLGFTEIESSHPNYFYIKEGEKPKMRYECQKHKLHKFLPIFDVNKTEKENMANNGYYKQGDCGNFVFVYRKE